jgi:hypothetical protein
VPINTFLQNCQVARILQDDKLLELKKISIVYNNPHRKAFHFPSEPGGDYRDK